MPPKPLAVPPAIEDKPGIPAFAMPPMTVLPTLPRALPNPPRPIFVKPLVARPPKPPKAPPKAVPIPGTNTARGATFLTTFFKLLPIFLKKPNSSSPVDWLRLAMPMPTTACAGSIPRPLNLSSTIFSNLGSSIISGGNTISPGRK